MWTPPPSMSSRRSTFPPPSYLYPPADNANDSILATPGAVFPAIRSFPNWSAGGPDGLRPQHLKDLLGLPGRSSGSLLAALTSFSNLVLKGLVPSIRPYFFGASLIALNKKGGGIRPIAMGSMFRRLVAKVASWAVKSEMSALLAPFQLGFGVKGGVETAIHAARCYLRHLTPGQAVIKLDFKNAFNSVRRNKMLGAVLDLAPKVYQFVHSAYSMPSSLFWGDRILHSMEGVQQGDPLGPLLFCLAIHQIQVRLSSELKLLYLDDVALGGTLEQIERGDRGVTGPRPGFKSTQIPSHL